MIFSVVIPCYNCVKTLEATVNSIRACSSMTALRMAQQNYATRCVSDIRNFGVSIRKMQVFPLHAIVASTRRRESISGLWMQMTR